MWQACDVCYACKVKRESPLRQASSSKGKAPKVCKKAIQVLNRVLYHCFSLARASYMNTGILNPSNAIPNVIFFCFFSCIRREDSIAVNKWFHSWVSLVRAEWL